MANFCAKCGKELEAGVKHTCEEEKEVKEVKEEKTASVKPSIDIKESFSNVLNAVKGIFTKPFETINELVTDSNFITGIILIVITALASGLSTVINLSHIYSKYDSGLKPKYVEEFFKSFSVDLVKYAAIAFIAYLVISVILKGKATWKETLSATGLSLIITTISIIIHTILIFFEGDLVVYISGYVSTFAAAFFMVVLYEGLKAKASIDKNKLFISLAGILVGAEIVVDLFNKIIK